MYRESPNLSKDYNMHDEDTKIKAVFPFEEPRRIKGYL